MTTERYYYDAYGLLVQLSLQQKWHRVSYTIESMYAGLPIAGYLVLIKRLVFVCLHLRVLLGIETQT